jgi:hypothetical protein
MKSNKLTMADFTNQIDTYLYVFVDYCKTFNIDLFNNTFFIDPANRNLTSKTEIKQELINFFKPKKEVILEYRYEYFTEKSIEDISAITGSDISGVIAYIERIKKDFNTDTIKGLSKYGDVTSKTRIKNISSYKIMQHFQLMDRQILFDEMIKTRKKAASLNIKKYL